MPKGEFLLEVRSEEIPARMLEPGMRQLATRMFEELMDCGLAPKEIETGFTPRRLMLTLKGLKAEEPDRTEDVLGPALSVAYDGEGQPTPALTGFARKCGVEADSLQQVQTEKGEYLAARTTVRGRKTVELLSALTPKLLSEINWPRVMRWGESVGPWVRPVHGLLAIFQDEVVPFHWMTLESSDQTVGHPRLSPAAFRVKGASDYRRNLEKRHIHVRFEARRDTILEAMKDRAQALGGVPVENPQLLDKLAAICEIPGVIEGSYAPEFLSLPREILITSLQDHQSAFAVEADGKLLPHFLTVMDRPDDPDGRVQAGNEWVVAARLSDAQFFLQEDRKTPLADRGRQLEHLSFQEQLGSYSDKTERVMALAQAICQELEWKDEMEPVVEAARLLKADLTTEMVKEFTSLQGVVGGLYAHQEGYPQAVWQAVYDQYLPASVQDDLPRGRVGKAVGLADRLDTIVGIFGLGLVPTGSKDPFGLRRAAQGVIRIALEGDLRIDLGLLAAQAVRLYGDRLEAADQETQAAVGTFLADRVRHLLDRQGFAYDEIEAALSVSGSELPDLRERVAALHRAREEPGFLSVVLAAKRIANIVKEAEEAELRRELLVEEAEKELYEASQKLRADVEETEFARDYETCFRHIASFADVLDRFFVEVLVMDEDKDRRENRIALLQYIQRTLSRTVRLTEVVVDKSEQRQREERSK